MCKYVQDTYIYTYRILTCQYMILTCQYRILTCQYHIRTVSIGPYLHVSERILVNSFLLLPPCLPALACASARGRCTFAWAQARGRCTFKFDALSLRQVRRAGSADAGESSTNFFRSGSLDWTAAAAGNLNSSNSAAR
jgi:hypothetical protein